ncbi:hypothetical protein KJ969_01760 [Patescibacteria group bacterium]|nr:hypothetical protein [Patescibacteria group bacterium]
MVTMNDVTRLGQRICSCGIISDSFFKQVLERFKSVTQAIREELELDFPDLDRLPPETELGPVAEQKLVELKKWLSDTTNDRVVGR